MDEFFASADTSAAGRGDGKVSKLELRNAVRRAAPHTLCAGLIALFIARTVAKRRRARRAARVGASSFG